MYWSTSNGNGLWRSAVDGSGAIAILRDNVQTIGKVVIIVVIIALEKNFNCCQL